MRNEADISALLSVQRGFKITFKQWMSVSVCIPEAWWQWKQWYSKVSRQTGEVFSITCIKSQRLKSDGIFLFFADVKMTTSFFPLTRLMAHNPLSPEPPAQPGSLCHCYWRLVHFPFHPSDLLKIQSHGEDPAFTAHQRTVDNKANVKRQHDKAHRGRSSEERDDIFIYFHSWICHLWTYL